MRGCQKRVIYMKNTGSRHFEGAYFVLRQNSEEVSDADMIKEANRIINENFAREKSVKTRSVWRYTFSFLLGSVISLAVIFAVKIFS